MLKKHGTLSSFGIAESVQQNLSENIFTEASHQNGHGRLCYIAGLFRDLRSGSTFHSSSWSVTFEEALAVEGAIDEGNELAKAIEELVCSEVN